MFKITLTDGDGNVIEEWSTETEDGLDADVFEALADVTFHESPAHRALCSAIEEIQKKLDNAT